MTVDAHGSVHTPPLFRQIVDQLKAAILGGQLVEHDPLPSERAIAKTHHVSRMTARRALEAIEAEGLAYSEGRKGRFVSPKRLDYDVSSMADFISSSAAKGIEIEMELLQTEQIRADAKQAGILLVPEGTELFRNTRLFRRDGQATFLETETVIAQKCSELIPEASSPEPVKLSEQRYSPLGHTADILIRMRALNPDEASLLGLMPFQIGIEQEHLIRDQNGVPFCFCRQLWRGEMAQFSATAILN